MDRDAALLVDMVAEGAALVRCVPGRGREKPTCSSRSIPTRGEESKNILDQIPSRHKDEGGGAIFNITAGWNGGGAHGCR
jgi:hypothetical protein